MEYQKGHIDTWLQSQAKLLKNVSTIGQNVNKILILGQSFKTICNLRSYSKKYIPTLSQHAEKNSNPTPICISKINFISG
jgi:hypothetical protein